MAQATYVTSAIGTLITGVNAKQSTNRCTAVQPKIASALAGYPSRTFPLDCNAIDLEDRAGHSNMQFTAPLLYEIGRAA
jgi:hypothetical protein